MIHILPVAKLCTDCDYFVKVPGGHYTDHKCKAFPAKLDWVTGIDIPALCFWERQEQGRCGPTAERYNRTIASEVSQDESETKGTNQGGSDEGTPEGTSEGSVG